MSVSASADTIVTTPTAYSLQAGEFQLEYLSYVKDNSRWFGSLEFSVGSFIEIRATYEDLPASGRAASMDVQYGITQPIPEYAPGLAVGIMDVFDETDRGISPYVAFTSQLNIYSEWAKKERAQFTLGFGIGGIRGLFLNFYLPVFRGISLFGEHDTHARLLGIEVEPAKGLVFRAMSRDSDTLIGIQFRRMF